MIRLSKNIQYARNEFYTIYEDERLSRRRDAVVTTQVRKELRSLAPQDFKNSFECMFQPIPHSPLCNARRTCKNTPWLQRTDFSKYCLWLLTMWRLWTCMWATLVFDLESPHKAQRSRTKGKLFSKAELGATAFWDDEVRMRTHSRFKNSWIAKPSQFFSYYCDDECVSHEYPNFVMIYKLITIKIH